LVALATLSAPEVDLLDLVSAARTEHQRVGTPDLAARLDRIDRLRLVVSRAADDLVQALEADYGHRSPVQSLVTDVLSLSAQLRHTRRHVATWMKPTRRWVGLPFTVIGGRARIEWQPLGLVGIISPWNFPAALTIQPAGQALAAGNRAICKVSEATPATAEVLRRAVAAVFDPTELAVVTGGTEISAQFAALPFDHLFFTGSTATGRHVLRAAADQLTPVTLELGGKCPVVIGPGADIERCAATLLFGKTLNAGQFCVAPDYVFVPRLTLDAFVVACRTALSRMYTPANADDLTAIVNDAHYDRLLRLVDDARQKGASVLELSERPAPGRRIAPTLVIGVDETMTLAHEEIFGPVLPVLPYDRIAEVIEYVKAHPKPLAAYYFGRDSPDLREFIDRTESGGVTVNDIMLHVGLEDLPFGGIGESGMGTYHGRAGFETFSHAKPVVTAPRPLTPMLAPPYPGWVQPLLRRAVRLEELAARRATRRRATR
jgi:coniferyl-aldehyde dehydrogenase